MSTTEIHTPMADLHQSPLGKRLGDGSPAAKRATPLTTNTAKPLVAPPSSITVEAPATGVATMQTPETPRTVAVDNILSMAFKMDRQMKEAEEDEKLPGEAGRLAERANLRARRKSKELQKSFQEMMNEKLEKVFQEMMNEKLE